MYSLDDTIAAISTPTGQGGMGIVRLSGDEALRIAQSLFRGRHRRIEPFHLHYGHIVAPETGRVVDEVLLSYMKAPRTYTRQDVVEINGHAGAVALREILSLCLEAGARLARRGEFSMRAFLNGRIDLTQAEAIVDIVRAKTETSLQVALGQLEGQLSQRVRQVRSGMLDLLAHLEAAVDFPEDEIPEQQIGASLQRAEDELRALLREAERGILYREGIRVVIVGRPNVGKSSLLNALLRTERAIVTAIPGTTRDTLEETVNLQGIPLLLVDTAGIGQPNDLVERLGMERSQAQMAQADIVLVVVDGSIPTTEADTRIAELAADKPAIVIINKSDLPLADRRDGRGYAGLLPRAPHIAISALTGAGMSDMEALLLETILGGRNGHSHTPVVSNPRHRELFHRAQKHIGEARCALEQHMPVDLVAIDVTEAIEALDEITGESASEDLLERIFASFCIGK